MSIEKKQKENVLRLEGEGKLIVSASVKRQQISEILVARRSRKHATQSLVTPDRGGCTHGAAHVKLVCNKE